MKYSILIPAIKKVFLYDAIQSVLQQSFPDFELIIVDDCSKDDLKSVIDEFHDSRIKYYRNSSNIGAVDVVDNWNKCLEYAKGDYIICMGDDDLLGNDCLHNYNELMLKYPNLNVYHTWSVLIDEKSNFYEIQQPRVEYESAYSLLWNRWNGRSYQFIGDFCFNRNALCDQGGFYKTILAWKADDINSVSMAIKTGIANTQKIGFYYRVNSRSITNSGHHKLKIKAILQERIWISKLLSNIDTDVLSDIDNMYVTSLRRSFKKHYVDELKFEIKKDFKESKIYSFIYHMNMRSNYGLSFGDIIIQLIKSLVSYR